MALQDAVARLGRTTGGRILLVAVGIYALIVLGDGTARLIGMGPYVRDYEGEVVAKHQPVFAWAVHLASGRAIFSTTDKKSRKAPVGPWRLEVRTADGEIEVAVPRRVYEDAVPGMRISCRRDPSMARLGP